MIVLSNSNQTKSIRLNETVVNQISERAKNEHRSFSNMIEVILLDWLKKEE